MPTFCLSIHRLTLENSFVRGVENRWLKGREQSEDAKHEARQIVQMSD